MNVHTPLSAANVNTPAAVTSISMADPATLLASTIPNSKPREQAPKALQTYSYQDFASAEPSALNAGTFHERVPPQSLQSQKLPSKLAAMLSDPDHAPIITWMPHGRSWKILNRELFSTFALPRYFGHSNHASFVRIVNAWGFRRITKGPDRDSYYHEMFLRGKPRLHERMKRLPTCHKKTPVDKDEKSPDFYGLAKTSPLPEASWYFKGPGRGSLANVAARTGVMNQLNAMNQVSAASHGNPMAISSFGMEKQSDIYANASSSSAMESFLSNHMKQGSDVSSFLKLLCQQGQPHLERQGSNANAMNQNLMAQFLRLQQSTLVNQPTSTAGSTLGQLASVASFAQPPLTASSVASHQQRRRVTNDKISVNDVMQLRSIERTNELLAQKLALMQQDTRMMKKKCDKDPTPVGKLLLNKTENANPSSPSIDGSNAASNSPTKEELLLQLIRCENQRNGTFASPANVVPTKLEDNTGTMSQGLNNFLRCLNGRQQQPTRSL